MKHLNLKHSAATLFLLSMITACSTENAVIGNVNVTDIRSSACKTSVSPTDTRPEYYQNVTNNPTVLHLKMVADNTVNAQFTDVLDNCMISHFHVEAGGDGNKLVLILYPNEDMATDCICQYDVNFTLKNLASGSYQLDVYHTTVNKQTAEWNKIYRGSVTFAPDKPVTLTMKRH